MILSISVLFGCGQFSNEAMFNTENIDNMIRKGEYTAAEQLIKLKTTIRWMMLMSFIN